MTDKQVRFCEEYVKSYNAVQSYKIAYECDDYNTARCGSYRMLKNDKVKQYIRELQKEMVERAAITAEKIAYKLDEIANDESMPVNARLKAYDLLQKQYNLQTTKITADVKDVININIISDDEVENDE